MRKVIIGIGGMTNGGKTTLSKSLQELLHNSCVISQDTFFKDVSEVPSDISGFKEYDTLDALHMDRMMTEIGSWQEDPKRFMASHGCAVKSLAKESSRLFVLLVEGFLIFNHRHKHLSSTYIRPLNALFNKKYFLQIPYDMCKERRSTRVYVPPDPPGYFDGYVWPMYLKNRKAMEETVDDIVFLDGTQKIEILLSKVFADIQEMLLVS